MAAARTLARGASSPSSSRTLSPAPAARRPSSARRSRAPTRSWSSTSIPARERAEDYPGVTGLLVAQAAADAAGGRRVAWMPASSRPSGTCAERLREGDLVLTLGAGDVDELGRAWPLAEAGFAARGEGGAMARVRACPSGCSPGWRRPRRARLGWLWFRDSSFVAVERVMVNGSGSSERDRGARGARACGRRDEHAARRRGRPARHGRAVLVGRRAAVGRTSRTRSGSR